VERFTWLVDELAAYESHMDHLYYAMLFVDDLKEEIKTIVTVQRPHNLDTACALALAQEEAVDSSWRQRAENVHIKMMRMKPPGISEPEKPPGMKPPGFTE
jgi:hypothetical protein